MSTPSSRSTSCRSTRPRTIQRRPRPPSTQLRDQPRHDREALRRAELRHPDLPGDHTGHTRLPALLPVHTAPPRQRRVERAGHDTRPATRSPVGNNRRAGRPGGEPGHWIHPPATTAYIGRVLRALGYRVQVRIIPFAKITAAMNDGFQISKRRKLDPGYPDPSSYVRHSSPAAAQTATATTATRRLTTRCKRQNRLNPRTRPNPAPSGKPSIGNSPTTPNGCRPWPTARSSSPPPAAQLRVQPGLGLPRRPSLGPIAHQGLGPTTARPRTSASAVHIREPSRPTSLPPRTTVLQAVAKPKNHPSVLLVSTSSRAGPDNRRLCIPARLQKRQPC